MSIINCSKVAPPVTDDLDLTPELCDELQIYEQEQLFLRIYFEKSEIVTDTFVVKGYYDFGDVILVAPKFASKYLAWKNYVDDKLPLLKALK